jgi:hypothetical protein
VTDVRITPREDLRADCARCAGLCCVLPGFTVSADFAIDKPAGTPCPNLATDHRCTVHDRLRPLGFPGCVAYDCFGAGQRAVRGDEPERTFAALRHLHELLWYVGDALDRVGAGDLRDALVARRAAIERAAEDPPEALAALDAAELRREVGDLLGSVSAEVRSGTSGPEMRGADRAGWQAAGADLRGADLRGSVLIGADLRGADLRLADLLGADLRGAQLAGADLSGALYLTRMQVGGALGDRSTRLPGTLERPAHWEGSFAT